MNENTFWIRLWTLLVCTGAILLLALLFFASVNRKVYLETISKASDPIAIACAVSIKDSDATASASVLCVDKARK